MFFSGVQTLVSTQSSQNTEAKVKILRIVNEAIIDINKLKYNKTQVSKAVSC
jgi:hypothetical protein